jgi:hypothetical protein
MAKTNLMVKENVLCRPCLSAAFDGAHGWFCRNRLSAEVTITLNTSGDYMKIKRVLWAH